MLVLKVWKILHFAIINKGDFNDCLMHVQAYKKLCNHKQYVYIYI